MADDEAGGQPGAEGVRSRVTGAPGTGPRRPEWPDGAGRRRPSGRDRDTPRPVAPVVWTAAAVCAVSLAVLVFAARRPEVLQAMDEAVRDRLATADGDPAFAADLAALGPVLGYRVLWVPTAALLVWAARWRHLAVYLGSISLMAAIAQIAAGETQLAQVVRSGVTGSAVSLDLPAWPVIVLSTVAAASLYALAPSGPARRWGWSAVVVLVAGFVAARVALGLDALTLAVVSAVLGASAAVLVFAVLAPESEFPVTYRRRVKAHLDLDEERTGRVLAAVRDQLGLELADIHPYRLDGSAGSTPCRLTLAHGPPEHLFGKLYATSHMRSDRWYKLARVLRWGRLEDEAPFSSVRRLVQHEDYMLRLLRDGGVRVPEPLGVVEVLPGREYLLVTELVPDAVELLDSPVDDAIVDDALRQVLTLWSAGAAHRDLKPSNVLVQGDRVYLVDVSFGELRPSRWRQAVDLADMMLTLAVVAGPRRVVERAAAFFEPEEMAEAFAATNALTVPRQLAARIAETRPDLVEEFRALLPECQRIRTQRWSVRRVLLAVATGAGAVLAVALLALNLRAGGLL
ncbi:RIO1 family regulatory kinase/ATPase domain-containing protein [Geodermatophilus sp. CPCC 205506]|uniref:RIO1 family regulatory kinase/ATPase domain-containing protein n=1 Tax=Geodermatophilus sp. CPCC 205506 TaxID=2936596 RepID=UPI003EED92A8